jgi:membrane fusion protein, copper/silver efflux system
VLGPRCGDYYPVVRGLEPGQRVAVTGAFLLDAETRLNPSLAAGYFGASGGRRTAAAASAGSSVAGTGSPADDAFAALSPADRALAKRQMTCPVTGMRLGSMGAPDRQVVSGRVVFLCCTGCRSKLVADPARYLAKLPAP